MQARQPFTRSIAPCLDNAKRLCNPLIIHSPPIQFFFCDLPLRRFRIILPHTREKSVFLKQLAKSSLFFYMPLPKDIDAVRFSNRRQPVGDHDNGFPFGKLRQRLAYPHFIIRIRKCGSFIKNQDRRVFQNPSGNSDPLLLPARQIYSARSYYCIHAVRQFFNNILALRSAQSLPHLFTRSPRTAHPDIFQNRVFQKTAVLKHKGHLLHQCFFWNFADINAADAYLSFLRIKKFEPPDWQSVVFPPPEGPTKATVCPSLIDKETSSSAFPSP